MGDLARTRRRLEAISLRLLKCTGKEAIPPLSPPTSQFKSDVLGSHQLLDNADLYNGEEQFASAANGSITPSASVELTAQVVRLLTAQTVLAGLNGVEISRSEVLKQLEALENAKSVDLLTVGFYINGKSTFKSFTPVSIVRSVARPIARFAEVQSAAIAEVCPRLFATITHRFIGKFYRGSC